MKFSTSIFPLLSLLILTSSCQKDGETKYITPSATGTQGRIVVVMSKETWNGKQGEKVREILQSEIVELPQPEAMFGITHIPLNAFSSIMKRERNLFVVEISSKVEKTSLYVEHNKWAIPQIVVNAQAKNNKEFEKLLAENSNNIVEYFTTAERERLISTYKRNCDKNIRAELSKKYNIHLAVPQGYTLDVADAHFAWLSLETPNSTQALLIWDYPYNNSSTLKISDLIHKRDSITMHNVPGPRDSSFMTTEKEAHPIVFQELLLNGRRVTELRGLWKTQGAFMGGPFVSHTSVDTLRNRIVTIDGFVYGGKNNKRNLMRQVEAIMHTLEFTPASSP